MAEIIFSSSYDEKNPPKNILYGEKKKFFSSTGMFPQQICIQFDAPRIVQSISIVSYGIKKISIETCENDSVVNFKKQAEQSEIPGGGKLQNIKLTMTKTPKVKVLKIEVLEGHEDFFIIQSVSIL